MPRILLVDDHPENRNLLATMLRKQGHQVVAVGDGRLALRAVGLDDEGRPPAGGTADCPFAAVLMDVRLPGLDGREVTRRLRAAGLRDLPVLAVTAQALPGDREACLQAGMDRYVAKPLTMKILGEALRECGVEGSPAGAGPEA